MPRKEKTETKPTEPKAVHPWGFPAYAAARSAAAAESITEACAPVTRVVSLPPAIVGGFVWGLMRGTYAVWTEMPVLPVDPALAHLAEQLGITPGQPIAPPQAVNIAEVVTTAVTEANAPLIAALQGLVGALTAKESAGAHINGPAPAPAAA